MEVRVSIRRDYLLRPWLDKQRAMAIDQRATMAIKQNLGFIIRANYVHGFIYKWLHKLIDIEVLFPAVFNRTLMWCSAMLLNSTLWYASSWLQTFQLRTSVPAIIRNISCSHPNRKACCRRVASHIRSLSGRVPHRLGNSAQLLDRSSHFHCKTPGTCCRCHRLDFHHTHHCHGTAKRGPSKGTILSFRLLPFVFKIL